MYLTLVKIKCQNIRTLNMALKHYTWHKNLCINGSLYDNALQITEIYDKNYFDWTITTYRYYH